MNLAFGKDIQMQISDWIGAGGQHVRADAIGRGSHAAPIVAHFGCSDALPSLAEGSRPQTRSLSSSATNADMPSSPGRRRTPSSSASAIRAFATEVAPTDRSR